MILPWKFASFSPRGDWVTGFQWHDICSIHARQSIFQVKTSWRAKVKILNKTCILHIGSRFQKTHGNRFPIKFRFIQHFG
jgi:hypothetical protein